jgi:hypothetical protein
MIIILIMISACANPPSPQMSQDQIKAVATIVAATMSAHSTSILESTNTLIPTETPPASLLYVNETYGIAFDYPPTWTVAETIIPKGTRLTQRSFNRFDAGSDNDELVVEVTKASEWMLEIIATKSTEDCGGYSSNFLEYTDATLYQPLAVLGRSAVRLRPEDGHAWNPSDYPEPYPVIVAFPDINGECQNSDEEWVLFSFSDNQKPLSLNITYYSGQFTKNNLQNRTIDYSTLQEMDKIVQSLTLLW